MNHPLPAYCSCCGAITSFSRQRVSHLRHACSTFLTCGLWGVVWISAAISAKLRPWRCETCGWYKPEFSRVPLEWEGEEYYDVLHSEPDDLEDEMLLKRGLIRYSRRRSESWSPTAASAARERRGKAVRSPGVAASETVAHKRRFRL
jgi:hypothetical protein